MNELQKSPHDHALCYAGYVAFIRGLDIPETIEQARAALVERCLKAEAALTETAIALQQLEAQWADRLARLRATLASQESKP